jgi:membrane-associated phospholipid phosphatase
MNKLERFRTSLVILFSLFSALLVAYSMPTGRRGIGYASLGMLVICCRWLLAKKKPSLWLLAPGIVLVLFYVWRSDILSHAAPSGMRQATFDLYALYVDGSFGTQPSVWISQLLRPALLRAIFQGVYEGLPLAMAIAYASFLEERTRALRVFGCFLLAGTLGILCYRLLPVCGPAYLPFGDECFYFGGSCSTSSFFSGTPALIEIDPQWSRNGMPSLHMGWALLVWWSCREKKYAQWIALAFAFLTSISTMVYGEHYLVDLLAASFFSLIPWSICLAGGSFLNPRRALALATGALGYLAWIMLIRYHASRFWLSPLIPWAALLVSCAVPLRIVFSHEHGRAVEVAERSP